MRWPVPTRRLPLVAALLAALAAAALAPAGARAQDSTRIAAVVNEDAISVLDIIERSNLIFATTGLPDNEETRRRILPQVLRTLIDESLQLQEAQRMEYDIDAMNLAGAYQLVEQNLGLPTGQLLGFLSYNNLSQASLDRQLRAEILWNELVQRRMRQDEMTEEDIDDELLRIEATADEPAFLLAEIFLAVDEPERDAEIAGNMQRLREAIMGGASFPELARQFSQASSAAEGGDLGWIAESQLTDELREVVPSMQPGTLSDPIRVVGGYALLVVRDRRQGLQIDPLDAEIVMRQAIVPPVIDETPDGLQARAREVAAMLSVCADFDTVAAERPDVLVSQPIALRLRELQPVFLEQVQGLAPDEMTTPIQTDQGLHILMVCERSEPESALPSRAEIRAALEDEQFDLIARGYLRDLRQAAFVDVRL